MAPARESGITLRSSGAAKDAFSQRVANTLFGNMLSREDRRILDFERGWWLYPEPKDLAIREVLGLRASTYYRRLRELLELPEARAYDPLTVRRLQRLVAKGA